MTPSVKRGLHGPARLGSIECIASSTELVFILTLSPIDTDFLAGKG